MKWHKNHLLFYLILLISSCTQNDQNDYEEEAKKVTYQEEQNRVSVQLLKSNDFKKELVSNGKLHSVRKSNLSFASNDVITGINVKNGVKIQKGKLIAFQDNEQQKSTVNKANLQVQKALIEFENIVIGQGFDPKNTKNIPETFLKIAQMKSGYSEAVQQHNEAKRLMQKTKLTAPFTGKIANLKTKVYEQPSTADPFCTIIDDSKFEVTFSIMENELSDINPNMEVTVIPISSHEIHKGYISEINPIVDENGLITVKALLENTNGRLMEGMNVDVKVENSIPDQLIVPKSAVVLRQNKEVLFLCKKGKAYWTYIEIAYENSTSYAIKPNEDKGAQLHTGDSVIVTGNLNLAHDSPISTF